MPQAETKPADVYISISYKELIELLKEAPGVKIPDKAILEVRQVNPHVQSVGKTITSGTGPKMRITPSNMLQVKIVDPKSENSAKILRDQRDLIAKLNAQDLGNGQTIVSLKKEADGGTNTDTA